MTSEMLNQFNELHPLNADLDFVVLQLCGAAALHRGIRSFSTPWVS